MNDIINNVLLEEDKLMPEMHVKHSGFTYSACGSFTKINKEYKSLNKLEIQDVFTEVN